MRLFHWMSMVLVMALLVPTVGLTQETVMIVGENGALQEVVRCATETPSVAEKIRIRDAVQRYRMKRKEARQNIEPKVVPIAIHVITWDDGSADVSDKQIDEQMDVLNRTFQEYGFQFTLDSVERVPNTDWSQHVTGSEQEREMKETLAISPATTLNLYICDIEALGFTTIPWSQFAEDHYENSCVIKYTTLPGRDDDLGAPYNEGDTAVHEVGHFLGLFHTFENGCNEPGDEVDDTPYQAEATEGGCPVGNDTCPQPGEDPIHNFMDYSDDACMNEFTEGQRERMHTMIETFKPSLAKIRRGLIAAGNVNITDPGQNGAADPGETVELSIPLTNNGNTKITSVSATMTTRTQGIEIVQGKVDYPEIEAGGTVESGESFAVAIDPDFHCSDPFQVTLKTTFQDDAERTQSFDFIIPTAELIAIYETVSPNLEIPNGDSFNYVEEWATSEIAFSGTNDVVKNGFSVDINITHPKGFALVIILESPDGKSVKLQEFALEGLPDVIGNYPNTLDPEESLDKFLGTSLDGIWTLSVGDIDASELGRLNSWGIKNSYYQCEAAPIQPGDINGSGGVSLRDAIFGLQILADTASDSETVQLAAAIGQEGPIGLDDVIFILRQAAAR